MLWIVLVMVAIIVLAGLVVAFTAFPHRGEEIPAAPWLGEAMTKAVDALPTLDNVEGTATDAAGRPVPEPRPQGRGDSSPLP